MTTSRQTGENIEAVLQRARDEEAAEQNRRAGHETRRFKATRVADLETPVLRVNKPATRRKISTFTVILMLFGAATLIVLYISHIITVNHLAVDADRLEAEYEELQRTANTLQAEIDRKSSRERIVHIASTRLNLRLPEGQARWITVENPPTEDGMPGAE